LMVLNWPHSHKSYCFGYLSAVSIAPSLKIQRLVVGSIYNTQFYKKSNF
jgi:hypothetical protein